MQTRYIHRYLGMAITLVLVMYGTVFAMIPFRIVSSTGDFTYTASTTVTLNIYYPGATKMQLLTNNATWSAWGPVPATMTKSVTLPAGDGVKTVFARFQDAAGSASPVFSTSINLDTKAPTGSVSIAGGVATTDTLDVTLSLAAADANGVTQMQFSNDGTTWSILEPFAPTKSYTLSGVVGVPGAKKVLARFRDPAGKISASATDTILYVTSQPTFLPGAVTISNNIGGNDFTTTVGVKLSITKPDPTYTQMSLSSNGTTFGGWVTIPAAPISYTLPAGDGIKTVFAKFRAGSSGTPTVAYGGASIKLDSTPPMGAIVINGGAFSTNNPTVTLSLPAADLNGVASMQFSANGTTWGAHLPYAETAEYTFSGDGVKKLYARFTDNAGKVSATFNDTIIIDTTHPTGTVKINSGTTTTRNPLVTLAITAPGATQMNVSVDGGNNWLGWEPFATSRKVTLPDGAGEKSVSVMFRDITANESLAPFPSDTITLNSLQGTYKVISRSSSFWQSIWDNNTYVSDNVSGNRISVSFNGLGACSVTMSGENYYPNGTGGVSVNPNTGSKPCTYTGPDADGAFAVLMNDIVQARGHVSYDGNSVVLGGAQPDSSSPDGTSYDVDTNIGVRTADSGMTVASINGTYNLVSQGQGFWKSNNYNSVSDNISGNNISATFNGNGGCSVTFDGEGYYPNGSGGIFADPNSGTSACAYTVDPVGKFIVTTTSLNGTENNTGWVSGDGNSVVMGGASRRNESAGNDTGTSYSTDLTGGVKAGVSMDVSSVSGSYHLTGSNIAFGVSGNYVSKNYWGSQTDISFDGAGACTVTNSGTGYHVETNSNVDQSVVTESSPAQTVTACSYTIQPEGTFTVTLTTPDGVESHSGWASVDGNSVVMGGAKQNSDNSGTSFSAELMFGVKTKL
jgi:hypothetical protein